MVKTVERCLSIPAPLLPQAPLRARSKHKVHTLSPTVSSSFLANRTQPRTGELAEMLNSPTFSQSQSELASEHKNVSLLSILRKIRSWNLIKVPLVSIIMFLTSSSPVLRH